MEVKTFAQHVRAFDMMRARPGERDMPFLEMVSAEQFKALRDYLTAAQFTDTALRGWVELKPGRELDLVGLSTYPPVKRELVCGLDVLIRLFVLGEAFAEGEIRAFFPARVWEAVVGARLLVAGAGDSRRYEASVALYPIRHLYIASDRWTNADHTPRTPFPDIVYPALTKTARQFIDFTSYAACDDFLEVCAGTAPAALLVAPFAKNVWATDITERSVEFGKFNAALNGIENVHFAKGDLYAPVEEQRFDRIAAHPPYVPVLAPAEIFYGGGEDGEQITKRIIAELPARLKPSGRLYCRTLGTERPGEAFEARVRKWLGEKSAEYDVGFFPLQTFEPRQFALEETLNKSGGREQLRQWEKLFTTLNVQELVVGMLVIQRPADDRPTFTLRRTIRPNTPPAAVEGILSWEATRVAPGAEERLPLLRPIALEGTEIVGRHALRNGEIVPVRFTLSTEYPFAMDCNAQPWMAFLLPLCNGKNTIADLFEMAKENAWIVAETPRAEFCRLIATLISGGLLRTEEPRLPAAAG